ncbi:hypothetical protein Y1Q_0019027 [Alligator mississippiensis]|uniref:Uncharacterized protein n=1 Tax=Alligator mississippiensis TaxID=8496 RepID=A0A151NJV9_ALLMI|nr:hypothetical protein Y1Q_0019027 [Alligator mississippiensis]
MSLKAEAEQISGCSFPGLSTSSTSLRQNTGDNRSLEAPRQLLLRGSVVFLLERQRFELINKTITWAQPKTEWKSPGEQRRLASRPVLPGSQAVTSTTLRGTGVGSIRAGKAQKRGTRTCKGIVGQPQRHDRPARFGLNAPMLNMRLLLGGNATGFSVGAAGRSSPAWTIRRG